MFFRDRRQLIIFIAAGAVVAGFVFFRYLPLKRKIKAVEKKKAEYVITLGKATAEGKQMAALKTQLAKMQTVAGNYNQQVPSDRDLGGFLHTIAKLMSAHELKNQMVQPAEEIEVKNLYCIPILMQCKGGLSEIFAFYKSLQELDRLVRIEQVNLDNKDDFDGEVRMRTKATIYYRPGAKQG